MNPALLTWPVSGDAPAVPSDGLLLYLQGEDFTNDPQTTTWADRSPAGHDGTCTGFAYSAYSGQTGDGAVVFDGYTGDDLVTCPTMSITSALTICAWIDATVAVSTFPRVVAKEGDWGLLLRQTAGWTQLGWYGSGTDSGLARSSISGMTFACVTYSADDMIRSYINCVPKGTIAKTGNLNNTATAITVGNRTALGRGLQGSVAAALVYNRVITAQEMSVIMALTAP